MVAYFTRAENLFYVWNACVFYQGIHHNDPLYGLQDWLVGASWAVDDVSLVIFIVSLALLCAAIVKAKG